jgi:hypothetical protein
MKSRVRQSEVFGRCPQQLMAVVELLYLTGSIHEILKETNDIAKTIV